MPNYTPGLWQLDVAECWWVLGQKRKAYAIETTDCQEIARTSSRVFVQSVNEANANLIAKAPELAEAIRRVFQEDDEVSAADYAAKVYFEATGEKL